MVETIGGATRWPWSSRSRALKAGKSVVSSNKELVATHGYELLQLAQENTASAICSRPAWAGASPFCAP